MLSRWSCSATVQRKIFAFFRGSTSNLKNLPRENFQIIIYTLGVTFTASAKIVSHNSDDLPEFQRQVMKTLDSKCALDLRLYIILVVH